MEFVDAEGNIIVPRAVRPIINIDQTVLGDKKGAARQYRYGNLHIRDYDSHYTVHMDKIDPRKDPLGHLLVDAPEYLVGAAAAVLVGRHVGRVIFRKRLNGSNATRDAIITGCPAGSAAGKLFFAATNAAKKEG